MLKKSDIDKNALKLLLKYDVLANFYANSPFPLSAYDKAYLAEHANRPEDIAAMKSAGLAYDPVAMAHDDAVDQAFSAYAQCKKEHVTDLFLASFSSRRLDFRSGLGASAIMQNFPEHAYKPTAANNCAVCGAEKEQAYLDYTALNKARFKNGGLPLQRYAYQLHFYLQRHGELPPVKPSADDFSIFNAVLACLTSVEDKCTPKDMHKELKKVEGFKPATDECKALLETLGYCSILETPEHKGYLTTFTNPATAPSKSRTSNWAYPVDFWTGADGVNKEALAFWFGGYKEIKLP